MKKKLTAATASLFLLFPTVAVHGQAIGEEQFPKPIDEQSWVLPKDMTWDDYNPIPGIDWHLDDFEPEMKMRGALILVDFPDQEFIITQEEGSELAGNPVGTGSIPREDVPKYYEEFLNKPSADNNYKTIDGYWKENSYGKWGVEIDSFGPYQVDANEFQYGLNEFGQQVDMPEGYEGRDLFKDAVELAKKDIEASGIDYDFQFILHAGYDESGVWQELGEMMFNDRDQVTDEFGPNIDGVPNWAVTRYVPWTSYYAAKSIWSKASPSTGVSIQGENDGMGVFAHEFGHIKFLGDNYNNPYGTPVSRSYSGPWELMSRGAFGGPEGPHTRWMIPSIAGSSMPSHHMLRNKIKQGLLTEEDYVQIDRDELINTGPVFTDIIAREVPTGEQFNRSGLYGINIAMEDLTPKNSLEDDWRADMQRGEKWYDNYTIEVVDRIGADSFQSDAGVLIAKTKDEEAAPNIWVVDAHPEDINEVDFVKPDGTEAMLSKGDYQQLSDALFHAGTDPGIESEYIDEHNRLHFYILDKQYDKHGVLSYRVAVRHLDSDGNGAHSVELAMDEVVPATPNRIATYQYAVTNSGEETDLIRISASSDKDWETYVEQEVIEVPAGETVQVPVYVKIPENGKSATSLTFEAKSEIDPQQSVVQMNTVLHELTAASLLSLTEGLASSDDIEPKAARAFTTHLASVAHYEKQQNDEKALKHLNNFQQLLERHQEALSEKAQKELQSHFELVLQLKK